MAWQGIPYMLRGDEVFFHSDLVLRQIPKIVVESDSGWVIFASVCSAIVAGGLPAFVAWRALRANAKSLRYQLEKHEEVTKFSLKTQIESSTQKEYINSLINTASEIASYAESLKHVIHDINDYVASNDIPNERYHLLLDMKKESQREFATRSWRIALLLDKDDGNVKVFRKGIELIYNELNESSSFNTDNFNEGLRKVRDGMKKIVEQEREKLTCLTEYD